VIVLFTGFGNMPIYKRYYISNLPGLGWSSNFYINLNVHYIVGALLLIVAVYFLVLHLRSRRPDGRLTTSGKLRAVAFGLALMTGIALAVRNLSGVNFYFGLQMAVTLLHLGMAMFLLVLSIGSGILKKRWTR
jgi:hypothetical protein